MALSDKKKKIDWDLTPKLCLDDGREYGGAVWLYFHRDVRESIKELKDLQWAVQRGIGHLGWEKKLKDIFGEELCKDGEK